MTLLFTLNDCIVHIFCPNCGKHIDVSTAEIERLEGHYVCPQCLVDIDLDGFEQAAANADYVLDDEDQQRTVAQQQEALAASKQPASGEQPSPQPSNSASIQPPAYKAPSPQHADDVLRYCKNCGTFLRQGVNFCPKCGKYVKVTPPTYQSTSPATNRPPSYSRSTSSNYSRPNDQRNSVRKPMATKTRKTTPSTRKQSGDLNGRPKGILSIAGCLTFTVIVVAIFIILYILLGSHVDGLTLN